MVHVKQMQVCPGWQRVAVQLSTFLLVLLAFEPLPVFSHEPPPGLANLAKDTDLLQYSKQRTRRRVGDLDVTNGAMQYMEQLRERLVDKEGRPVLTSSDDPTNVWCILDRDMTDHAYRPKSPNQRCTVINRFIYNLKFVADSDEASRFPIHKSILRAHLQVIPRLLKSRPVKVNVTVTARLLEQDSSESVFAGRQQIDVTADSNGWVELNVTEGLKKLWPSVLGNTSDKFVEFLVKLQVNCIDTKKVPAAFVEPTSIKLSQKKRRGRHTPLQPLLLVHIIDEDIKEIVKQEQDELASSQEEELEIRASRQATLTHDRACEREDYWISFGFLELDYILAPQMYNAYRCAGSCSHEVLSANDHLGTNHAKIMASAKEVSEIRSDVKFSSEPRDPCCTPTRYKSLSTIISSRSDIELLIYPAMIVTECGCR